MPLLTLEGLDRSGKSTLATGLTRELSRRGANFVILREPGGTPLGERVRGLLKGAEPGIAIGDMAELMLFNAARAELLETVVRPRLAQGSLVILDRFTDSTLAYQAHGRGLDADTVAAVCSAACEGLEPDLTLLLVVSAAERRRRLAQAGAEDRIERAGTEFFERVRRGYRLLAQDHPQRILPLDADEAPEQLLQAALAALTSRGLI